MDWLNFRLPYEQLNQQVLNQLFRNDLLNSSVGAGYACNRSEQKNKLLEMPLFLLEWSLLGEGGSGLTARCGVSNNVLGCERGWIPSPVILKIDVPCLIMIYTFMKWLPGSLGYQENTTFNSFLFSELSSTGALSANSFVRKKAHSSLFFMVIWLDPKPTLLMEPRGDLAELPQWFKERLPKGDES
jgi:hypothetical protein